MQDTNKAEETIKLFPEKLAKLYHNEVYKRNPDVWMIWGNGIVTGSIPKVLAIHDNTMRETIRVYT